MKRDTFYKLISRYYKGKKCTVKDITDLFNVSTNHAYLLHEKMKKEKVIES